MGHLGTRDKPPPDSSAMVFDLMMNIVENGSDMIKERT
jgi:hypothetical protein